MPKKVNSLGNLLHLIPLVVILFEYVAVSSALAYARYHVEAENSVISLLGGLIKVGGNLPFDAVPNTVVTLHLLGLLLSVLYLIYYVIFGPSSGETQQPIDSIPPQEG